MSYLELSAMYQCVWTMEREAFRELDDDEEALELEEADDDALPLSASDASFLPHAQAKPVTVAKSAMEVTRGSAFMRLYSKRSFAFRE